MFGDPDFCFSMFDVVVERSLERFRSFTSLAASAAIFELCWAPTSFQLTTENLGSRSCKPGHFDGLEGGYVTTVTIIGVTIGTTIITTKLLLLLLAYPNILR